MERPLPLTKAQFPSVSLPHDNKALMSVFAHEHISGSWHSTWKLGKAIYLGLKVYCHINSPHFTAEKIEARRVKPRELDT